MKINLRQIKKYERKCNTLCSKIFVVTILQKNKDERTIFFKLVLTSEEIVAFYLL